MWHKLTLQGPDGQKNIARYNSHTSVLEGLDAVELRDHWHDAVRVSKTDTLGKSRAPEVLKIQLGLSCNFSCSYCSQAGEIHAATVSKLGDVELFLTQLDTWIEGAPKQIELWGGEPFVYWAKIKRLLPAINERFPDATLVIITNGSMFNRERIEFIKKYDIQIGISHDGPGQDERGPDPFKNPMQREWIKQLLNERKGAVGFNCVLTRDNHVLGDIKKWFVDQLCIEDLPLGIEGVVNTYDENTLAGVGKFNKEQLGTLTSGVFQHIVAEPDTNMVYDSVTEFKQSILEQRPIEALGQKCGMDRREHIAVDLKGNVMTCQNTGAQGEHNIGHVEDMDAVELNTSTHFAFRKECLTCPVVQLCKGSCMFLEGEFFEQSCKNEFALNMGILQGAMYEMSGGHVVTSIERED